MRFLQSDIQPNVVNVAHKSVTHFVRNSRNIFSPTKQRLAAEFQRFDLVPVMKLG